jgi:hypothetical protein
VLAAGAVLFLGLLLYSAVWRRHGPLAPVVAVLVAAGLAALLRRARVAAASIAVVLGGLGLQLVYWSWTDYTDRNIDATAQLDYINFVLTHHVLPANSRCVVCHHPPLYYLLAAGVRGVLEAGHVTHVESGLMALSLVLSAVFLLFSVLVIERLATGSGPRLLATALVVFWPYTTLNSVRVHNDAGLYPVAAITLYLLVRWVQDGGRWRLVGAGVMALVGLAVKSNAAILVGLVLVLVAYRALRAADRRVVLREAAPVVALLLCLAVGGTLARGARGAGLATRFLGTAYKEAPGEVTERSARFYLTFSPTAMVARPYAQARWLSPATREPTYWNHLLKSSVYGTRITLGGGTEVWESPRLARAGIWVLLALTAFLALGLLLTARAPCPARTVALLAVGVYVLGGLAFHLIVPISYHADFRFIFPVIVPLAVLYAQAAAALRSRLRLWPAWVVVAGAFIALNVAYFLPAAIRVAEPGFVPPARLPAAATRPRVPPPGAKAVAPASSPFGAKATRLRFAPGLKVKVRTLRDDDGVGDAGAAR